MQETTVVWDVTLSGQQQALTTPGNAPAPLRITLVASAELVTPGFSDGACAIAYSGVVAAGQVLVFDGPARKAALDGTDVTPYTAGEFPRVGPAGTALAYTDAPESAHEASVTAAHRARWW